jgi:NADH-quinone oxidoreductase subunit N
MKELLANNFESLPYLLPELCLFVGILVQFAWNLFSKKPINHILITAITLIISCASLSLSPKDEAFIFNELLHYSNLSFTSSYVLLGLGILILPIYYFDTRVFRNKALPEILMVFLCLILSGLLLIKSDNWIVFTLSFESIALLSYLLFLLTSNDTKSIEASYKYFLFGVVCSAFMLLGIGILYAITGEINAFSSNFLHQLSMQASLFISLGLWLFFIGFFFKLSLVPFHFWAPDVYEAGSNAVLTTLAILPKFAVFIFLFRFVHQFSFTIDNYPLIWPKFDFVNNLGFILCATFILSNTAILRVYSFKRILAYAGMSQMSFMLVFLLIFSNQALSFGIYYFIAYALGTCLVFVSNTLLENTYKTYHIEHYTGLAHKSFFVGIFLLIGLVRFIGLPGTAGFIAKFFVFSEAIQFYSAFQHQIVLFMIILALIVSIISVYYYLCLPLAYFFKPLPQTQRNLAEIESKGFYIYAVLLSLCIVVMGLFPNSILNFIHFEANPNLFIFP